MAVFFKVADKKYKCEVLESYTDFSGKVYYRIQSTINGKILTIGSDTVVEPLVF